ncbi:hypothetical protein DFH06DRAFT_1347977 [Mycena polygramma]|nr:hypothetical protein DFH06DRAFT_1347977 [Mycena polygramma]
MSLRSDLVTLLCRPALVFCWDWISPYHHHTMIDRRAQLSGLKPPHYYAFAQKTASKGGPPSPCSRLALVQADEVKKDAIVVDQRWYASLRITPAATNYLAAEMQAAIGQPPLFSTWAPSWGTDGLTSLWGGVSAVEDWTAAGWGTSDVLARRTLQSGKEFSSFDLALGATAIEPAEFFNVEKCLACTSEMDEPGEVLITPPFWINPSATPAASTFASTSTSPAASTVASTSTSTNITTLKKKSKHRRRQKREAEGLGTWTPTALLHTKPAWIGMLSAEHEEDSGMGGRIYSREEIEQLTGSEGFQYINWLERLSIPIIDSEGRIIAVLGGMPRDAAGWKLVTDTAATALASRVTDGAFTHDQLHHRRAQDPYPSISRGISHGGGQTEPGELCNNVSNTRLTDGLLREPCFQRLAGFANCLFQTFAPMLFAFYQAQMGLIAHIFAACTFNFGPHAITVPHLDFGNLAWGWCAITALGNFDPDVGGHLILWNLKLVIRFPPGSTILIPSAIIRHSNVPIRLHERRFSFTQYTAGGLFRWIRNGFRSDKAFNAGATSTEKAERAREAKTRWETGVGMYSTVAK